MQLGLFIGSTGSAPTLEGQIQQVVEAENDGFHSFWFSQAPNKSDVLTLIALAGQQTSRIEMGTAVVAAYSRHPHTLALQGLTASAFSDGRLALGIGTSHRARVEGGLGLPFDRPASHIREYLTILRDLVQEGKSDFNGEIFNISLNHQVPDARPFSIFLAAHGPVMLKIAGALADGAITWMSGPKAVESYIAPHLSKSSNDAGRPMPRICVGAPVAVTEDISAAREAANVHFGRYNQMPSFRRMMDIEGVAGPADMAIVGNEAEVERQLRAMADAGASDMMANIFPVGDNSEASVARTRALLKSLVGKI